MDTANQLYYFICRLKLKKKCRSVTLLENHFTSWAVEKHKVNGTVFKVEERIVLSIQFESEILCEQQR